MTKFPNSFNDFINEDFLWTTYYTSITKNGDGTYNGTPNPTITTDITAPINKNKEYNEWFNKFNEGTYVASHEMEAQYERLMIDIENLVFGILKMMFLIWWYN